MSISKDNKEITNIFKEIGSQELGTFRYRMGIISDRHVGASWGKSNLIKCLTNLYNHDVEFVIESGDMTLSGLVSEWEDYVDAINSSPITRDKIHTAIGNHDLYSGSDAIPRFNTYANNGEFAGLTTGYFYKDINGDRFIFLQIGFSTAQLDWLEQTIASYTGTGNIWVLAHYHFQFQGAGDFPENPYYAGGMKTQDSSIYARLLNILNSHQNIFYVHGHSHYSARYIENDCPYVVSLGYPGKLCAISYPGISGYYTRRAGCIGIHCPSGTRLRYSNNDSSSPNSEHLLDGVSESIAVDVYENGIRLMYLNDGTGETICTKTIIIANKEIKEIKDENNNVIFTWR